MKILSSIQRFLYPRRALKAERQKNEILTSKIVDLRTLNSRLMRENRKLAKDTVLLNMEISLLKEQSDAG